MSWEYSTETACWCFTGYLAHPNAQAGAQFANLTDLSTTSSSAPWCCKKLVQVPGTIFMEGGNMQQLAGKTCCNSFLPSIPSFNIPTCDRHRWFFRPALGTGGLDTATAQGGHLGFGDVASAFTQTRCTCFFLSSRSIFEIGSLNNGAKKRIYTWSAFTCAGSFLKRDVANCITFGRAGHSPPAQRQHLVC